MKAVFLLVFGFIVGFGVGYLQRTPTTPPTTTSPTSTSPPLSSNQPPSGRQPTFGIGSTQAEVRAVLGPPTGIVPMLHMWEYGTSMVQFDDDGRVVGWQQGGTPLPVH